MSEIVFILGTRPEIIKMYSVIKNAMANSISFKIIHSNQHYDENMDSVFFKQLNLPEPNYNLAVGSGSRTHMVSAMLEALERILLKEQPRIVLVQGDTNTTLAGALAASMLDINVGHI